MCVGKYFHLQFDYLCMFGSITIHVGRCYCLVISNTLVFVADVIALADFIAMFLCVVSFNEADVFTS